MPKRTPKKPTWPHPHKVTMGAHASGQWVKRVNGKLQYFGPVSDPDGALERYYQHIAKLERGEEVNTTPSGIVTVADVFNRFLTHRKPDMLEDRQQEDRRDRALGPTMFNRYAKAGRIMAGALGRGRAAGTLTPADFAEVKAALEKRYSIQTLAGYINCIRSAFTWAYEAGVLDAPARFGADFRARGLKRHTRRVRREKGKKLVDPATVRALLDKANPEVYAAVLLGLNCGFYAQDVSDLTFDDVDLEAGVIRLARYKTEIDRICPLWPESIEAIREVIERRPEPKNEADADRVFLTRRGSRWVISEVAQYDDKGKLKAVRHNDYLNQEWCTLWKRAKLERPTGLGFGALRHTFYTIGRRTKDYDAVDAIMGHSGAGMVEHYLENVELCELRAVTDHIRAWLGLGEDEQAPAVAGQIGKAG